MGFSGGTGEGVRDLGKTRCLLSVSSLGVIFLDPLGEIILGEQERILGEEERILGEEGTLEEEELGFCFDDFGLSSFEVVSVCFILSFGLKIKCSF